MQGDRPGYFNASGLAAFQAAELEDDDVLLVSYPKCGTTWLHQILFCLLRMDAAGNLPAGAAATVGGNGQVSAQRRAAAAA